MENENKAPMTGDEAIQNEALPAGRDALSGDAPQAVLSSSGKSKKKTVLTVGGVLIAIAAIAVVAVTLGSPTKLQQASETCLIQESLYASLDDDGKGLYLDGEGEESLGMNIYEQLCVLNELEVPDSVISRMSNTTSLMGQQEGSWDGITALWTYHPSNGLDISLELD